MKRKMSLTIHRSPAKTVRNVEYASTNYNDFKISQKQHRVASQSVQTS